MEGPLVIFGGKGEEPTALVDDVRNSIAILRLKETVEKSSAGASGQVMKILDGLNPEVNEISKRLHEDRIPQLLSQMTQLNAVRGKYFYLTVIFIALPLLLNLLVLPQLSQATAAFLQPIIFFGSILSVLGVAFLLLYVYKILNV